VCQLIQLESTLCGEDCNGMMAAGTANDDAERRRDKLSLRIRKEGKIISDPHQVPKTFENDERNNHEVPLITLRDKSCAESDNR